VRGARQEVPRVAFVAIELGDEHEEAVGRGVQVSLELGDLGFEALEDCGRGPCCEGGWGRRFSTVDAHRGAPNGD